MAKKTIITIVVILTSIATLANAEESKFDFSFNSKIRSAYVAPIGINVHDDPVVQSSITMTHEDFEGWFANIWYSGEFGSRFCDRKNDWATETDYTIGWANDWFEWSVSYWDCGDNLDNEYDIVFNSFKINNTFSLENDQTLTPYIKLATYTCTDDYKGNGMAISTGLFHRLPIEKIGTLNSEATIIWGDGPLGTQSNSFMGKIGSSLNYKLNDKVTLSPGLAYYFPISTLNDGRGEEFVIEFGISF